MATLYRQGQFNGSIVVAVDERPIYRNGFGEADFQTHRRFDADRVSNLGSVSKQFTSTAIMMLAQAHRLSYDDRVGSYVPELADQLKGITLRHLLNHTSGIPDVGDLGIDQPRLATAEVLARLARPDHIVSPPGEKYRYSNANYVLLGEVIKRVTGQPLATFLESRIFAPLDMRSTFLYDGQRHTDSAPAKAYDEFGNEDDANDLIPGADGIYSTVDDLLKWDRGLFSGKLVSRAALDTAFTPGTVKEGTSSYGFGWNITEKDGRKFIWHQGATGGYRALLLRVLANKMTIIILTNRGNTKRLEIADAILNILDGKRFSMPKRSIAQAIYPRLRAKGVEAAIKAYIALRASDTTYDFNESELNSLGYQLLSRDKRPADAVAIFELNTRQFPGSSNAFDSLGEAYEVDNNRALAIASYRTAVALDSTNFHAVRMLKKLQPQ